MANLYLSTHEQRLRAPAPSGAASTVASTVVKEEEVGEVGEEGEAEAAAGPAPKTPRR